MANAAATARSADQKNATSQGWTSSHFNRPTGSGIALRSSRLLAAANTKPTTSTYTPRSSLAAKFAARDKPSTSRTTKTDYGANTRSTSETTRPSSTPRTSTFSISFTNKLPETTRRTTGRLTTDLKAPEPTSSRTSSSTARTIVGTTGIDYLRTRRKPDDVSSASSSRSLTTKMAGVPEVISRFGSRSPAFLAGGVVRTTAPTYSTSRPSRFSTSSPPSSSSVKPIRKEERPWRVRMAEQSRLRNLETPTISFTSAGGATSIVTRTRPTNTEISKTAVKESTPVSSLGLRNYESKFSNRYSASPVSSISSSYSPSKYRHSVPVGRLSRNSSTASSTLSLFSPVNSPRYLSPTFAHGSVSQARQSSLMTRSLYTPFPLTSSYHPPPSRMSQSYTASELKRMGEGTKWTPIEPKGIPEERRSRDPEKTPKARSRSVSKKRRSRSRSIANEPPPPASSSDSASENENGKVGKRKKLRKKSSTSNLVPTFATTPNTTKSPVNKPKTTKMPANFEGQLPNESKSEIGESITAKSTPLVKTDSPNKNDTEYHAVTTFKPAGALKKKKILEETSNKPVPGVWNGENEVFISCNKSLLRKESKVQIEVVMKHIPHSKTPTAYFKVQKKKRIVIMSRNKIVNASFMKPRVHCQAATLTLKDKNAIQKSVAKLNVKEPKKIVKIEEKTINEHLVKNKQMKLNVEKKWSEKKRSIAQKLALKCKAVSEKIKTVNMNINRRSEQKTCNGTVRLPAEAQHESVQLSILQPMNVAVTLAQPPKIITILSPERIEWSDGFSSPELYERELHIPLPPKHQPGGPLVLPDQSTLEEYVKRKRNHLETIRIYNSPEENLGKNSVNATGAEALRADSNMTPRPNDPVQVIQAPKISPAPPAAPGGLLRAMLRKTSDPSGSNRLQPMKAVFDTPKSPFEEKMQQQANKLRQAETEEPKADNKWKRRSMDSDLAQGFQALAAQHSNKPAERYAAHIPINVPSGRQSVASVDSVQSVALDKASQQLDQMIDQARYKHQQHRTKFKEAIDYLDQIFEDLKKETVEPSKKPTERTIQKPEKFPVGNQLQARNNLKSQPKTTSPQRPQLAKSVSQDGGSNVRIHPQKQPQPARFQQTAQQKAPSAVVQKANAVNAQFKSAAQRPKPQKTESCDVEVTETFVLPSKNSAERLDYTRKWLQDDIKTWVDKPGSGPLNNQIRRVGSSGESDEEHSLGSCSAEVAAINAAKREKRDKQAAKDKKIKNEPVSQPPPPPVQVQQPINNGAPIKPRPYRPNEQGAPGFVITESYDLQKVNSHSNIRPSTSDSVDRAASTHEYSGGSQNSHDGKPAFNSLQRTASGAFVQFQRGSIQSLPDAIYGPTRTPQPYPPSNTSGYGSTSSQQYLHPPDPVHQMNALVAELELNTDPNFEKRRSFPTIQADPQKSPRQRPIANTTVKVQNPLPDPHSRLNVPQNPNYSGSMDRGMRRYEQEKDPLHSGVQHPAAQSSTLAQKLAPKQKLEDATSLLDSVIGELHPLDGPKRPKATEQYYNQNNNVTQPSWQQQMMMKKQQRMAQSQVQHQNNQIGGVHVHQHQPGHVHIPQMGIRNDHQPNHFQTINEEKLNPSKVEKIHNLFEQTRAPRSVQRQSSREHPPEPVYSEISEFRHERSSSLKTNPLGRLNPAQVDRPSLPSTQPPNQPRGYLSPTQKTPQVQRQGSLRRPLPQPFDRVSLNSQNIEEEENFYDNIRTHRQEDEQSVTSRRTIGAPYLASRSPQPQATQKNAQGGRIGHLIRKLGGVPERPIVHQTSVHEGSVMSLNRVGQEQTHQSQRPGVLMKSNSLSGEPWRIHAIDKEDSNLDQKTSGIGNRLKQTLFGSRKWLNN